MTEENKYEMDSPNIDKAVAAAEADAEREANDKAYGLGGFEMPDGSPSLSRQEQNWMMMTTLQIPWKDCNAIEDPSDRKFLMEKVREVQGFLKKQQEMEMQQMQQQQMQQQSDSPIITPQDILQGK